MCSYSKHNQFGFTISLILYDLIISIFIPFLPFKFHFVPYCMIADPFFCPDLQHTFVICIHLLYLAISFGTIRAVFVIDLIVLTNKEIQIILRLFLVFTMYCQASSINHSTSHVASWLGRKPR